MALFHFNTKQIKRSLGKSAISSAAYISGRKLRSEYYGEYADYRRKEGVVYHEILLPEYAPRKYADQETLWNAVEFTEKHKRAQLAYAFNITLQNELSPAENKALAMRFVQEQFVDRGMICDFAIHDPDREDKEPNPHFHVLCPIRPLNPDGSWGEKQHREYVLDENGDHIRDERGKFVFNAVPTTDWGKPETLEAWRKAWCELCNEAFEKKGLPERIDHRSYLRQGIDLIPTEHEGPLVRQMESRGIPTEKGEKNRWIKATNALMKDIIYKIKELVKWIGEAKAILNEPSPLTPVDFVNDYFHIRAANTYSQKGKTSNVKEYGKLTSYIMRHDIRTMEDLAVRIDTVNSSVSRLKQRMDGDRNRIKELKDLLMWAEHFKRTTPIINQMNAIHFKGKRESFAEYSASDCAPPPRILSITSGRIEHGHRRD